jgi:phosphate transport system substrate-binding protein
MKFRHEIDNVKLMSLIIAVIFNAFDLTPANGATIKVGGTGAALGVMRVLGESFKKTNPTVDVVVVPGLGSGGGRKALMGGALGIAITSRPGKAEEKLEGATARLYGRSPFVFAVQTKNKTTNLTIQDIIDIYGDKKISWPNGARLRLVLRPITDSDSELLFGIGPDMEQALKSAHKRDEMAIAMTDEDSATMIESTPGGFGSSVLSLILSEKRALKFLSVKGITPSPKSIANGTYPWFKSFYLLTKPDASAAARAFGDFVLSAPAQPMLEKLGHWLADTREGR